MKEYKILIIEDDKMLSAIFEMFISEIGHEHIGTVTSCDDAVSLCKNSIPDLVLMDIHLEGEKDGIETAKILGKDFNIPVVYISGDTDKSTINSAVLENTYGFLTKPLHKETLEITVEFAVTKHKLINN